MTALPFDDASLDAVITLNTVYFIDDIAAALTETGMAVDHRAVDDKPIPRHLFVAQHRT